MRKRHMLDYNRNFQNAFEDSESVVTGTYQDPSIDPATGKAWTWIDKLLGVADQSVNIVNKAKAGTVTLGSNETGVTSIGGVDNQPKFLGMPRTVGIIVAVGVVGLLGFAIWKMNKK